jgi:hypothetical protein
MRTKKLLTRPKQKNRFFISVISLLQPSTFTAEMVRAIATEYKHGTAFSEFALDARGGLVRTHSSSPLRSLRDFFSSAFLPQGYPHSVRKISFGFEEDRPKEQ